MNIINNISDWVSVNPIAVVIGYLCTILGFVLAIIIPIITRRKKQLHYTVQTVSLVEEQLSKVNDIKILFNGQTISTLYKTTLKIWNGGNTIIEKNDIYEKYPLVLTNNNDKTQLLNVEIEQQSSPTVDGKIDKLLQHISFDTLEKGDYIIVCIYATGSGEWIIDGRIKEGKIINRTAMYEMMTDMLEISSFSTLSTTGSIMKLVIKALHI